MISDVKPELWTAFSRIALLPIVTKLSLHGAGEEIELNEVEELMTVLRGDDAGCKSFDDTGTGLDVEMVRLVLGRLVFPPWSEDEIHMVLDHANCSHEKRFITANE